MKALPAPRGPLIQGQRYDASSVEIHVGDVVYKGGVKAINYTTEPEVVVGVDLGKGRDKTVFAVRGYKSGVTYVADAAVGLGASDGPWCDLLADYEGLNRWAVRDALRGARGVSQLPARRRYAAARVMIYLRAGAAHDLAVEWARLSLLADERRRARNERKRDGKARGRRRQARNGRHHGGGAP